MNNEVSTGNDGVIFSNYELNEYMLERVYTPILTLAKVACVILCALGGIELILSVFLLFIGGDPNFLLILIGVVGILCGVRFRVSTVKRVNGMINSFFLLNGYRFHAEIREDGILLCSEYATEFIRFCIVRSVHKVEGVYAVYVGDEKVPQLIFISAAGFASPADEEIFKARLTAVVGEKKFIVRK